MPIVKEIQLCSLSARHSSTFDVTMLLERAADLGLRETGKFPRFVQQKSQNFSTIFGIITILFCNGCSDMGQPSNMREAKSVQVPQD